MLEFVELAVGNFKNRAIVKKLVALADYTKQAGNSPLYRSHYEFDENFLKYVGEHLSIAGYSGIHGISEIVLDIDKGTKTDDETLNEARLLYDKLSTQLHIESIYPYYSGTGYHIVIPDVFGFTPAVNTHTVVARTMAALFPECDSIFDQGRLVRVANTFNEKGGKWKVPLTTSELCELSAAQIRELADKPRDWNHTIVQPKEPHLGTYKWVAPKVERSVVRHDTNGYVTCMQKLYNGGETQGERHIAVLSMASAFRRNGVPYDAIVGLLEKWTPSLMEEQPTEVRRLVDSVFKNDMRYSCQAPLYVKYCDPKCIFFPKKNFGSHVVHSEQMEKDFVSYLATDFKDTAFDLREIYHLKKPYMVYPGEMLLVIGDTGVGKTTLVQNWCVQLKRMKILYYSLEVHQHLLFRKFIQIALQLDKDAAIDHYKNFMNTYSHSIDHILVSTKAPSLYDLRAQIAEIQPQIVVIDTTDSVVLDRMHGLEKEDALARGLKDIAQQMNIIMIGVHHIAKPNKEYAHMPLTVHSGKGSSSWEQKADKVISIEGNVDFKARTIRSLKARDESSFHMNAEVDWDTFMINQIGV